jgi:enterochelin esterase-like enzyme
MRASFRLLALPLLLAPAFPAALFAQTTAVLVPVKLSATVAAPQHGRLLIFAKQGHGDSAVETAEFSPSDTWIAGEDVLHLAPGASLTLDADEVAFPHPFSQMPAGQWEFQAVLDTDGSYNYSGRNAADWISPVVEVADFRPGTSAIPTLTLDRHPAANPRMASMLEAAKHAARPGEIEEFDVPSKLLTAFWGKPRQIRAWVILPPGYNDNPSRHYATAYWAAGFGGTLEYSLFEGASIRKRMSDGTMPPMIWVMLDESLPEGTHEFADSVNNGPWGTALTTEFIPAFEAKYRADARTNARFLNGHSSGGWATLQLEVNYPQVFGGTWSTSPDPSDFHNFTGTDLYAPHANVYHGPDGTPRPIMRDKGKVIATMQQFAQMETVLGPYGGQMSSFDWVFSPKSDSGAPVPMFNRVTGDVDPAVVAYWAKHYDLANIVERSWPERGALLKGRIHLFVGTADTFYLDGSAHLFEARLQKLGGDPHFHYLPGRTHFDLYMVDKDRNGLFDQIGTEMYAVAYPGQSWEHARR